MSSLINEVIADLTRDDSGLRTSRLMDLSNLNAEDLMVFEQAWAGFEPELRRQIVLQLVDLADDNFELNFDRIFEVCLKDTDAEVRSIAIEGLRESEEPSLINSLVKLLEQDSSAEVQVAAAAALGNFAMLGELEKLRDCYKLTVMRVLLAAVADESKSIEVRCRALEAVAPLSLNEVRQSIMVAYQSHHYWLKVSAVYAMGKNCDDSWLPILLRELTTTDAEMRYKAIEACGELGNEEAVPYLYKLISSSDDDMVLLPAIRVLGKIGGADVREFLEQCRDNPEDPISQAAEQALNELEAGEEMFRFKY